MANKLKTSPKQARATQQLKEEPEVQVTVSEFVKDERTYKIVGATLLLIGFFLFISFASYLFSWKEDQDKVVNFGIKIFSTDDVKVSNLFGVLGAYTSHNLIYNGFGLASFLICTTFFVLGVNLMSGKKIFSLKRNIKYVIAGILILSVAFAYLNSQLLHTGFAWGGGTGELISEWLIKWIGSLGTFCILLLAVLFYIIWRFDPKFSIASFKKRVADFRATDMQQEDAEPELNGSGKRKKGKKSDSQYIHDNETDTAPDLDNEEEGSLYIQQPGAANQAGNRLKNGSGSVTVTMPDQGSEDASLGLSLSEKAAGQASSGTLPLSVNEQLAGQHAEELSSDGSIALDNKPSRAATTMPTNNTPAKVSKNASPEDFKLEISEEVDDVPSEIIVGEENPAAKVVAQGDYEPTLDLSNYKYPNIDMLEMHGSEKAVHDPEELEQNKNQIITTLKNYDIHIQRISATVGPTVTLYEIVPAPGVRISRIKNLEDDIALSLAALGIRIIAPIPGRGTIGIEVPNINKTIVSMRGLISSEKFQNNKFSLPIAIGKKINNENFIVDLASMPHLLMAGATGQGKSVGVNALLVSLLYKKHPSQLKFVLVDPKKVELSIYRTIEHHFLAKLPGEEEAIITDTKKVVTTLNALCIEMDNRYDLLKEAGCRNIKEYNEKFIKRRLNPQKGHQFLPFIVLVIDEFADLIMTAGKEVEMPIARLAQLARAVGIHLIIATQRPSVNIITGTIKANFPARIAFKVSSKIDSRTILDAGGAEQLIGKGDMLISYNGEITRLQCAFVDTPEVDQICDFIGEQQGYPEAFLLPEYIDEKEMGSSGGSDLEDRDPLFEDAARLIVQNQVGSTSLIQRRMKLGYNRAGRLMDQLEMAGVVGANQGSKARDVLIKTDAELQVLLDNMP
ncbi:DNA segregation ATPase FtsK/SpoIIIE, S-DNA-T family [Arachidicoccus rhizosphaerae]|uniref:DNA segregation ATPase FtsK/SpoIIIE, S-DNA-T family n=1 Tax=Arachidicoccus rhizosphaerae TaxID=551991 RepID=A0A1H3WMX7_9BACT|nr:DNA translocase FtsK [Arachidicoccus rhizosphaerae]SDZ88486.1 DNA segregation ATPase FtsK/SpoIIIE, S-DNA-T family [Arachidicoccus rhizosphaerae]